MRILVTGGAGYIGSHAVLLFRARGHRVIVYDNLSTGHRAAVPPECLIVGDLHEAARLDQVFVTERPEAVVHFAAYSLVGESVRHPALYYQNNVSASLTLLDAMRRHRVGRIVFSSSCATYGLPGTVPVSENESQKPINPYGNTKLAIERALIDHARAYDWGVTILRYFNAAGASATGTIGEDHEPESHLIPMVIQCVLGQRAHIDLFGIDYPTPDGTCIRDYIHVDDLAEAHLRALETMTDRQVRAFNLGTGTGHSVRQVIGCVEEVTGKKIAVKTGPRREGDPPSLVAAADRAMKDLSWQPRYLDLRAIIETAWRWHRDHPRGYADRGRT